MNYKKGLIFFASVCLLMIFTSSSFMTSCAFPNQDEINDYVTPEEFGALGDGQTDDAPAINAALKSGKPVKLGNKTYLTKSSIIMPSNSELYGSENSKILNAVKSGYNKNAIVAGIAGSNQGEGSSVTLPKYPVSGNYSSKTLTIANADTLFNVGDTVLFTNGELQGKRSYRFVDAAKVIGTTSSSITIDDEIINDKLLSSEQLYAINFSSMSQYQSSNFNRTLYLASDVYVHDITIEMAYPDTGSGMYAIYANCIDSRFENIKMNNVTTIVGSNAFIRSVINNITANYYGGIMDMAEVQIRSTYSNFEFKRVGYNSNHQNEGFTINNGYLAHVYNVNIDNLDMPGAFRSVSFYDITYENCSYKTTSQPVSNASWVFMVNANEDSTTIINCTSDSPLQYTSVNNIATFDSMHNSTSYDSGNNTKIPRLFYDGNAFYTNKAKAKTRSYVDSSVIFIIDDVELNDSSILETKLLRHLIYGEDGKTITVNNGVFDNQFFSIKDGTLIINGGTYYKPIYVNGSNAKVVINGGSFLADTAIHLINGTVEVNKGTFKNGIESINAQGGTLNINDGSFTSYGYSTININNAKININKANILNTRVTSKYNKSGAILINSNQEIDKNNYLRTFVTEGKRMNDYELTLISSDNSYKYLSNKNISVFEEENKNISTEVPTDVVKDKKNDTSESLPVNEISKSENKQKEIVNKSDDKEEQNINELLPTNENLDVEGDNEQKESEYGVIHKFNDTDGNQKSSVGVFLPAIGIILILIASIATIIILKQKHRCN